MLITLCATAAAAAAVEERSEATVNEHELDDSHHFKDAHTHSLTHLTRMRRTGTHTLRQVEADTRAKT